MNRKIKNRIKVLDEQNRRNKKRLLVIKAKLKPINKILEQIKNKKSNKYEI